MQICASAEVVYLPDSGFSISTAHDFVDNGQSYDMIKAWLVQEYQDSVSDLEALQAAIESRGWEANGYYMSATILRGT
jgi:hypothetical protein